MNMIEALKSYYMRSFDFKTRSSRSEYWWVTLFNTVIIGVLITLVFQTATTMETFGEDGLSQIFFITYYVFIVLNLVPGAAVIVRRFHDQDKSGWFTLLALAPFGLFIIMAFMFINGTKGPNQFGYDPLEGSGSVFD